MVIHKFNIDRRSLSDTALNLDEPGILFENFDGVPVRLFYNQGMLFRAFVGDMYSARITEIFKKLWPFEIHIKEPVTLYAMISFRRSHFKGLNTVRFYRVSEKDAALSQLLVSNPKNAAKFYHLEGIYGITGAKEVGHCDTLSEMLFTLEYLGCPIPKHHRVSTIEEFNQIQPFTKQWWTVVSPTVYANDYHMASNGAVAAMRAMYRPRFKDVEFIQTIELDVPEDVNQPQDEPNDPLR